MARNSSIKLSHEEFKPAPVRRSEPSAEDTSIVKVLLLCSGYGRHLADEILTAAQGHVMGRSTLANTLKAVEGGGGADRHDGGGGRGGGAEGDSQCVTHGLIEICDEPVLSHWLTMLQKVPRLAPLSSSVYLMCNNDNRDSLANWATTKGASFGLTGKNFLTNGTWGSRAAHPLQDVQTFVEAQGVPESLVVMSGDVLWYPDFGLKRLVEASLTRGKDVVAYVDVARGDFHNDAALPFRLQLDPQTNVKVSPRVTSIGPVESTDSDYALAPLLALCPDTLRERVGEYAHGCRPPSEAPVVPYPYSEALGGFVQSLLRKQVPVYALGCVGLCGLGHLKDVEYTDTFIEFYTRQRKKHQRTTKATAKITNYTKPDMFALLSDDAMLADEKKATASPKAGAAANNDPETESYRVQIGDDSPLSVLPVLDEFKKQLSSGTATKLSLEMSAKLPSRFTGEEPIVYKTKQQHPMYQTANATYGARAPSLHEMPVSYAGMTGKFTTGFVGGSMFRISGFNTNTTKSRVHRELDDHF
eukprot:jgi/Mesvir1/11627/Mv00030-RA.1